MAVIKYVIIANDSDLQTDIIKTLAISLAIFDFVVSEIMSWNDTECNLS